MFDLKKLKTVCPSDLKKEKVAAAAKALKQWDDQIPEHAKDCKLKDVLDENIENVKSTLADLLKDVLLKREGKKEGKDKKPYTECELLVKDYVQSAVKYVQEVERNEGRVQGDYQRHLVEVMDGYQTCLDQMIETEKEMQIASLSVQKLEAAVTNLAEETRQAAAPKILEALKRVEKSIKQVLDRQTEINLQNKERTGPLRKMVTDYKIDPEMLTTGAISKIYTKQAEASNKIVKANSRLVPIINDLKSKLGA